MKKKVMKKNSRKMIIQISLFGIKNVNNVPSFSSKKTTKYAFFVVKVHHVFTVKIEIKGMVP